MERQRLEELKCCLETEKQQNAELIKKIRCQTKTVSNMQVERDLLKRKSSYHEDKLQRFMYTSGLLSETSQLTFVFCSCTVEKEKAKVRCLEEELAKEKSSVKHLKELLDMEGAKNAPNKVSPIQNSQRAETTTKLPHLFERISTSLRLFESAFSIFNVLCFSAKA